MCSHSSEQINSGIRWTKAPKHHQKCYWREWEIKKEASYEAWDFFCTQLFLILTLASFLGSIFYSLISLDLMLTWVKPNLFRFFLLTEDCFNINFKAVVLHLDLCFGQTDFLLPTTQSVDLSIWSGLLEFFCYMIWRYCVDHSAYIRWGVLQNEWPFVSFSVSLPFKANLL